jgi:hypothetical protein
MKPLIHAKSSVRKYGGVVEDYLPIHNFIDSSKMALPDMRHRIFLHNAFGIFLAEQQFGTYMYNADGKEFSVRDIAEDHVLEDLGFIPTLEKCVENLPLQGWHGGRKKVRKYDMNEVLKKLEEYNVD